MSKTLSANMRKLSLFVLAALMAITARAQDNMEAFRHLSIGAEAGFHGLGVELALPIQKHLVLKAGYNMAPSGDLFNTQIILDTKELREAQEQHTAATGYEFFYDFEDEAAINGGVQLGLTNYKLMLDWYPFASGRFYVAGGIYYTPSSNKDDSFIVLSGTTERKDWSALRELNTATGQDYELAVKISGDSYGVTDRGDCGYMQADYKMDRLKYYLGIGLGRCIPNRVVGLQFEVGAMIYHGSALYCQNRKVDSIVDAANGLGNDVKEILEYVDKYPVYPQATLRISFRLF